MRYDDEKFGVINRKWFGLTKKFGGDVADGYTIGSAATTVIKVSRWYPKGPVRLQKAGVMVLATLQKRVASNWQLIHRFLADGASGSLGITLTHDPGTATQVAPYTIASSVTVTRAKVKAGAYIRIRTATPQTDSATRLTASVLGSLAYFVDYAPLWDSSRWDAIKG